MNYDGSGKLGEALAALCGFSPKSNDVIARRIREAKDGLGITIRASDMPPSVKLDIYRWHYDRLHPAGDSVNIISQTPQADSVKLFSQPESIEPVNIISQGEDSKPVEIIAQTETTEPVEIISQHPINESVEIVSQAEDKKPVEIFSQPDNDEPGALHNLDIIRVAFRVTKDGKRLRQVIALDGFYINGLIAATGITRQEVPKWIQSAIDGWGAFDAHLPITRQVKYLIVRAMTEALDEVRK